MEDFITAAAIAVVTAGWAKDALGPWFYRAGERVREWREPSVVEQIHEEYATGEIGELEMEQRLEDALDTEAQAIRDGLRPIEDVGPTRAAEIADEFASLEAVRRASEEQLRAVEHVGTETAEKVREFFDSQR